MGYALHIRKEILHLIKVFLSLFLVLVQKSFDRDIEPTQCFRF